MSKVPPHQGERQEERKDDLGGGGMGNIGERKVDVGCEKVGDVLQIA